MTQKHRFGNVEVRPAERSLLIDGKPAELGSRAFDVLQALITHRDRVVTKDELLDMVWPGLVVEENNLQAQVSALRKVLGPKAIATIPGRGYQFVAAEEVHDVPRTTEVAGAALSEVRPTASAANDAGIDEPAPVIGRLAQAWGKLQHYKRAAIAIAGTAVVLVAIAVYWNINRAVNTEVKSTSRPPVATKIAALSIVVLPFTNLTGDASQAYVADAVTANLTSALARGFTNTYVVDTMTAFTSG